MKLLFGSSNGFTTAPSSTDFAALPFTRPVLDVLDGQKEFDGAALQAYRDRPRERHRMTRRKTVRAED